MKAYFSSQFEGTVHHGNRSWGSWLAYIHSEGQKRRTGAWSLSPSPRTPLSSEWCRPHLGWVFLLLSVHPVLKLPHSHAQRFVAMVILIPIQLTIKMNDPSLLHVFYPLQHQSLAVILLEAGKHLFTVWRHRIAGVEGNAHGFAFHVHRWLKRRFSEVEKKGKMIKTFASAF